MKILIFLIVFLMFLSGCKGGPGGADEHDNPRGIVLPGECAPLEDEVCKNPNGSPEFPVVGIRKTAQGIIITPRNVCAEKDTEIEFQITPNTTEQGNVSIVAENLAVTPWLVGSNSPENTQIRITIPDDAVASDPNDPSDGHKYYILFEGQCIDPRVHVR